MNSICQASSEYESHELLDFAKISCIEDRHCIGITDDNCDKNGTFHLCKTGYLTSDSYTPSCIYQKMTYSGNSLFSNSFFIPNFNFENRLDINVIILVLFRG